MAGQRQQTTNQQTDAAAQTLFAEAVRQHQGRNLAGAEALYRQVLQEMPDHADALHLLGVIAHQTQRSAEAVALISRAITLRPVLAPYHGNLGLALQGLGRRDEAEASFRRSLALLPDYAIAHNNLALVLRDQGKWNEAAASFRTAIAHKPDYLDAHLNLGLLLKEAGRWAEAETCLRRVVALRPGFAEAHDVLGVLLREQGRLPEAETCFREALRLRPDFPHALSNLGAVLQEQGRSGEAIDCYHQATALAPAFPQAHHNLGNALLDTGQVDAAIDRFRHALSLDPGNASIHANLANALLAQGRLTEGWQEYEWRWQIADMAAGRRPFTEPQWRGEDAAGKTLLIHAEQGLGDTLQFCRYAPLAAARGLRVVLEVQAPLRRLLASLPGVTQIVTQGETLPPFDLHCPMLSLPLAFGTTLETIPAATPYLAADPVQDAHWRGRLAALPGPGLRVGVVWAGNPRLHAPRAAAVNRRRSLDPALLSPLLAVPGAHFISLQKDIPATPPLTDWMTEVTDMADTAALIAGLDLVISVDTSVVHLAGALGTPVWMLDRSDPCWRWLRGREDSPWYPGLRLFRQTARGEWGPVITRVAAELTQLAGV